MSLRDPHSISWTVWWRLTADGYHIELRNRARVTHREDVAAEGATRAVALAAARERARAYGREFNVVVEVREER